MTATEGAQEKKWFIYLGDKHEGPFAHAEVADRLKAKSINPEYYVWAEGMADWQMINTLEDFREAMPLEKTDPRQEPLVQIKEVPEKQTTEMEVFPDKSEPIKPIATDPEPSTKTKTRRGLRFALIFWGFLFVVLLSMAAILGLGDHFLPASMVAGVTQPVRLRLLNLFPALDTWINPLPSLGGSVSPEDLADLRSAVTFPVEKVGAKVAVGLLTENLSNPRFVLSSNLPDATALDVYVQGVPETLLNQIRFSGKLSATLEHRLGTTAPLTHVNQGTYWVYITLPGNLSEDLPASPTTTQAVPDFLPPGARVIAKKAFFLGGPKDERYATQLREYHDKVRQLKEAERVELKKVQMTLSSQLDTTQRTFEGISKLKSIQAKRVKWKSFQENWLKGESELNTASAQWLSKPDADSQSFFKEQGKILGLALQAVEGLHDLQSRSIDPELGSIEKTPLENAAGRVKEALLFAQTQVGSLKARIDEVQATPETPSEGKTP